MTTVKVKLLSGASVELEVAPEATILDVKKMIEEKQGEGHAVAAQKLIRSGKILGDDEVISTMGLKESDFFVCMVTKAAKKTTTAPPKPAAPTPAASTSTTTTSTTAAPSSTTTTTTSAAPAPAAAAATTEPTTSAPFTGIATGSAFETAVKNMEDMGFERSEIIRAMRAAFNNPDRAVEYLMTGIPESLAREMPAAAGGAAAAAAPAGGAAATGAAATATSPAAAAAGGPVNLFDLAAQQRQQQPAGGAAAAGGVDPAASFAGLRASPQFDQLRQIIQSNPEALAPILQQLGAANPALLQAISQNQDAFLQMLNDSMEGEEGDFEEGAEGGAGGSQYIQITPEENEAINRLAALGFDRALAAEAYFACDKNEELAANYLFDHMGEM